MKPGESVMCDVVTNMNKRGLTTSSHFPYYLIVTDVKSRFTVPIGISSPSSKKIAQALRIWSRDYGPDVTFNLHNVLKLRADAAQSNFAAELTELLTEHRIRGTFAAPRHQEQNGICERAWQSVREIAFKMMVHAHVPDEFFDFALEHAWKIFNCLPIRDLQLDGKPCTPLEAYTGRKPHLARFRVLFCPCVIGMGPANQGRGPIVRRNNCPERGIRGIHVGLPRYQDGWLIYLPSTGGLRICSDVSFDENFYSTTAHSPSSHDSRFPGSQRSMLISLPMIPLDGAHEHTGDAWPFTSAVGGLADPTDPQITRFAQDSVEELNDQDDRACPPLVQRPSYSDDSESDDDDSESDDEQHMFDNSDDVLISEDFDELYVSPTSRRVQFQPTQPEPELALVPSTESAPPSNNRRSQRPQKKTDKYQPHDFIGFSATRHELLQHAAMHASALRRPLEGPNLRLQSYMRAAYHAEALQIMPDDISSFSADDFEPSPTHWKHIMSLPEHLKHHWIESLRKELLTLLRMQTLDKEFEMTLDDIIIAVTAKFRTKLTSTGAIDKLKSRICLRGDMQTKGHWDTWCPIAGFRALRIFLAIAARQKCRVFQLDFVGAFLQSFAVDRTVTTLPKEWASLFPDLAEWFGIPLLCRKSLYGGQYCNKSWDDHLSSWLADYGLIRLESEGSIFMLREGDKFLCLLNAVDDQLYFSNCDDMRRKFEAAVKADFDVDFLGQAHWYLQARITQHTDFSITLDQSRYAALICSRFIPTLPISNITTADCEKYRQPLPSGFIATKTDLANDMFEVKRLEDEFGFKYASVIGMLIFSLNTFVYLHFPIRKLAKFMIRPGRVHYAATAHLLRHLRCNTRTGGLTYYADLSTAPVTLLLASIDAPTDFPVVMFTDSSWQDCPDTSHSTGCYLVYCQGGLVDGASFVPDPIALSSAEAEYQIAAFGVSGCEHTRQLFQELHGLDPDTPLTIPILTDSQSAMAMASSDRDTRRTRHIRRRYHYVRLQIAQGAHIILKIDGTLNISDIGTKLQDYATFMRHRVILHTIVPA